MQTSTLTFPTVLPGLRGSRPEAGRLYDLLGALRDRWLPAESESVRMERQVRKSARCGRRIVLGTMDLPYEPLVLNGAPLTALRAFDGLEIAVTTHSPEILEQLDLLIELDRRHAVSIDVLVAGLDPDSPDLHERLRAASTLGAEGLTARLVVNEPTDLPGDRLTRSTEDRLRSLFEIARAQTIYDVVAAPAQTDAPRRTEWRHLLQGLRIEYGFPRSLPGRG